MTKTPLLVPCAALLSALCLAACGGGGPEGTYRLDKEATKKAMEADSAKLTGKDVDAAKKFGMSLVDAMDGTLELKAGGAATQKTSLSGLGKPGAAKTETGTWKKVDGGVTLDIGKAQLTCAESGKSLTCKDPKEKSAGVLVWTKA